MFIVFIPIGFGQSIHQIRESFHEAVLNPSTSEEFHALVSDMRDKPPVIKAYHAVSEALLAQVLWNPFSKLKQVIKYDKMITQAVLEDPGNIEIRFLRLAVEYNLPAFLGMSGHLQEDVALIVSNLSNVSQLQVNPAFGQYILDFLAKTDLCTNDQLEWMKQNFEKEAMLGME